MAPWPPDLEAYVQEKIATGSFASREELTAEAVRVYRELESRHAQLKADIHAAIDEANRGLSQPLDIAAIEADLIAEIDELGRRK